MTITGPVPPGTTLLLAQLTHPAVSYYCGKAVTSVVDTQSVSGTFQFTPCPRVARVTHTGGAVHLTVDARLGTVLTHPTIFTEADGNIPFVSFTVSIPGTSPGTVRSVTVGSRPAWITGAHLGGTVTGAVEGAVVVLTRAALYLTQRPSPRHVTETLPRHTVPMSITHTVTAFT